MPTYDYICTSCHNAWEIEQRIVEDAVRVCPKCGASTAKRQISAGAGFILKGGGWYADGYGSAKSSTPASQDDGAGKTDKTDKKADPAAPAGEPSKKAEGSPKKPESSSSSEAAPSAPAAPAKPSAA
jgi:putative FmdB family regulatory protein